LSGPQDIIYQPEIIGIVRGRNSGRSQPIGRYLFVLSRAAIRA
jgi:hypothetical protein